METFLAAHPLSASAWWGFVAGAASLAGSAAGYWLRLPQRAVAGVMAFGAGVLISALSYNLMDQAYRTGGFAASAAGFLGGAVAYTLANWYLARHGARHRKRSGDRQPSESQQPGSGLAIAVGAILDDIPESIAIGISMLHGGSVSGVMVAAIFISNIPEGLSSTAGMKRAGRPKVFIFGLWLAVAAVSALASLAGFAVFSHFSAGVVAASTAVAAGAILAMLADTMMPEAFAEAHDFAGLVTVAGFLAAFCLAKLAS